MGLSTDTIALLALAIGWGLDRLKQIADIKKVRAETQLLKIHSKSEIKKMFDDKIDEQIRKSVEDEVKYIMKNASKLESTRRNELESGVQWCLNSILSRLERGVIIQLKASPATKDQSAEEDDLATAKAVETIQKIAPTLTFPPTAEEPVLELPPPEPPVSGG